MKKQQGRMIKTIKGVLKDWGILLVTLIVVYVGVSFLMMKVKSVHVNGGSMEPTYQDGDCLWMKTVGSNPIEYERGDVVVVDSEELDQLIIKRIIGLPGDVIELKYQTLDGGMEVLEDVWVNGQLLDEPYKQSLMDEWVAQERRFEVPEDHLLIMGDNRAHSLDSRSLSNPYISIDSVMGRVQGRISNMLCR